MQWVTENLDAILAVVYLVAGLIVWRIITSEIRRRRSRANRWLTGRQAYRRMKEREARDRKARRK